MNSEQIRNYWKDNGEKLNAYRPSQLSNARLLKDTIDFLVECGLPDSCAPFLTFEDWDGEPIKTPNQVLDIEFEGLDNYLWIGSNGSGDPICIDLENKNEIVYLNHDNEFERIFINSSVHQLAESLIRYGEFYSSLNTEFENNVFSSRKFSDEEFGELKDDFIEIDATSLAEGNFWNESLEGLLWERDNEN